MIQMLTGFLISRFTCLFSTIIKLSNTSLAMHAHVKRVFLGKMY